MRMHRKGEGRTALSAIEVAQRLWESLDTPVSLSCHLLCKYKEFSQLVSKKISPSDYQTADEFFLDYQSVKFLSKYPYLDTKIDTKRAAISKFLEAEVQCSLTNDRIRGWKLGLEEFQPPSDVDKVLYFAQRKIASILGNVPEFEDLSFKFGPGACFSVGGDTSAFRKMSSPLECASAFTSTLQVFLEEFPGWIPEGTHNVSVVPGSKLHFVPKDAKTQRPICIEPLLNGLYQKGVGSHISNRLRRFGVNLRDQGINQKLAERALRQNLCTVDFASASDTISYMLVLELLPIDWFEFLDVARCPSYTYEGHWYNFHKFTSMGNAYTFELESMIFYALAASCCEYLGIRYETGSNLSVYGDDVIIPKAAFDLFLKVCHFCGFTINSEKSFSEGVFYESCGTDWFLGLNVRPILLKKKVSSFYETYYVANSVLEIASRYLALCGNGDRSSDRLRHLGDLHAYCVSRIPKSRRYCVPFGSGDIGLHCDFDVAVPSRHPEFPEWDGYLFKGIQARAAIVSHKEWPMWYCLYSAYTSGSANDSFHTPDGLPEILHSDGYSLRSNTSLRKSNFFWNGEWPTLPVKWNSRAVSLVANEAEHSVN